MITISHTQAHRLLQSQLDSRDLPNEQWAALQAHLEECADCRAYRDLLALTERGLRRSLHRRWDPVDGPAAGIAPELSALYRERQQVRRLGRRMVGPAAAFLVVVVLFIAWSSGLFRGASAAPPPAGTRVLATATPLPTPTRPAARFNGVVAYEVRAGQDRKNGEIYLLNPGADPVDLTDDPADDHSPAWSPDGQWLAFLSNRGGKDEVYVMHISGTRLTRLTSLPEVNWRGPLSWRSDGQMLALIGERGVGEIKKTWVYIVPLDGSNAYPLGSSAGATTAAFSPSKDSRQLAFANGTDWSGRLVVYDFDPAIESFQVIDPPIISPSTVLDETQVSVGRFDWSADGERLLFKKNYAAQSNVTGGMLNQADLRWADLSRSPATDGFTSQAVIGGVPPSDFPEFSWTGIQDEIAFLVQAADKQTGVTLDPDCKFIRVGKTSQRQADMLDVTALCVEDGLEQANWRTSQKSVLVVGHEPGHSRERGLYLLRFQGDTPQANWLADARSVSGPPRLRPVRSPLPIDPQPVRAAAALPPSPLPGPDEPDLLSISTLNQRTLINRLSPNRNQRSTINQSVGFNSCPTWSPDRGKIAFLSNRESRDPSFSDLYVMDSSGLNVRRLTDSPYLFMPAGALPSPQYSCLTWSPDGRWLTDGLTLTGKFLTFAPLDPKDGPSYYTGIYPDYTINQVAWLPDGRLLVAFSLQGRIILSLYNADRATVTKGREQPYSTAWVYINALAVSPDGKTLALAAVNGDPDLGSIYGLLTLPLDEAALTQPGELAFSFQYKLPTELPGAAVGDGLRWLPDGRLAYIVRYPAGRAVKAELWAIAPGPNAAPGPLASFTGTLRSAAFSPDGRWLTAITDSGRYVLDLALASRVAPAWVDGETGGDIDW